VVRLPVGYASRQFSKVMQRCPYCGSRRPKELVETKQFNVLPYVLFGLLTCGIGLLLPFLFFRKNLEAYCENCDVSFPYH